MKFHIEHNVKPENIRKILPILSSGNSMGLENILSDLQKRDYSISIDHLRRNLNILSAFSFIKRDQKLYQITNLGMSLNKILSYKPSTFYDIMHYFYYSSWTLTHNPIVAFSWTYKTISNLIFENENIIIDKRNLAGELLSYAQENFPTEKRIAISPYAIEGAMNWLQALDPPIITNTNRIKQRIGKGRTACSPELFLLGIDHLYKLLGLVYGAPILLDDNKIRIVCQLCLLDPNKFSQLINMSQKTYNMLIINNSEWGYSISLPKPVHLNDLT